MGIVMVDFNHLKFGMSRYIISHPLHKISSIVGDGVDNSQCVGDRWSLLHWAIIRLLTY